MKKLGRSKKVMSKLVPKNHFCSMAIFREAPLVNWTFTESILFTAYDIQRSSDFWLDSVISSGLTLKEAMIELGLPKNVTMMADTGVFEFEAKKAGLGKELGITLDTSLPNQTIFEAYTLSGADFYVAPDEIILPTDTRLDVRKKVAKIKTNVQEILEVAKPSQVISVLQGCDRQTIDTLFDFSKECGIDLFARGGLIPLWKHNKTLFDRILKYTRKLTNGHWLHAFGLPRLGLLPQYLHKIGMDSVDSSTLSYLTAKRQYLVGVDSRPVRLANFDDCQCDGCKILRENIQPRSMEFFVGLYIHNVLEAAKVACSPYLTVLAPNQEFGSDELQANPKRLHAREQDSPKGTDGWRTAFEAYKKRSKQS